MKEKYDIESEKLKMVRYYLIPFYLVLLIFGIIDKYDTPKPIKIINIVFMVFLAALIGISFFWYIRAINLAIILF